MPTCLILAFFPYSTSLVYYTFNIYLNKFMKLKKSLLFNTLIFYDEIIFVKVWYIFISLLEGLCLTFINNIWLFNEQKRKNCFFTVHSKNTISQLFVAYEYVNKYIKTICNWNPQIAQQMKIRFHMHYFCLIVSVN